METILRIKREKPSLPTTASASTQNTVYKFTGIINMGQMLYPAFEEDVHEVREITTYMYVFYSYLVQIKNHSVI